MLLCVGEENVHWRRAICASMRTTDSSTSLLIQLGAILGREEEKKRLALNLCQPGIGAKVLLPQAAHRPSHANRHLIEVPKDAKPILRTANSCLGLISNQRFYPI